MMCVLLLTIAALSVDLANAFARRTDSQTQADYGALAAARLQTESANSGDADLHRDGRCGPGGDDANQPQDDGVRAGRPRPA